MKKINRNTLNVLIKKIPAGISHHDKIRITFVSRGLKGINIAATMTLSQEEWARLIKFLRCTEDHYMLPGDMLAFAGYDVAEDRIIYHSETDIDDLLQKSKEYCLEIRNQYNKELINKHVGGVLTDQMNNDLEMKSGEIINNNVLIQNKDIQIIINRDIFKNFRHQCFLFT